MGKPIKVAFLGTGGIAAKHSHYLKDRADVQIVAGCDVKVEAVENFWSRTWKEGVPSPAPAVFTDAAEMYAKTKPDAVVICTPHTLHFEQAMQALDAGCHILMEKPMVTNAGHAYELRDKVAATGKIFIVGYNTPCSPEFFYLRNLIRTKELGRLEVVSGFMSQNWAKFTVGLWRQNPALSGGGMAYDSGAHLLNSLCWTVEASIAEVYAMIDNVGTPVDINSAINIRFENGVFAAIGIGGNCPMNGARLEYLFSEGRVEIDGWGGSWIKVYRGNHEVKYPPITEDMNAGTPAHNFIESILGNAEPRTSPTNGIIQSELMDAIYESAEKNAPAKPKRRG